ncbi:helix-turn-helix domain-containing protein [Mesorhizobium sp. M00.F.Ca.ET.158.01.1.1]|nr:helix-turn-helix domain-containing protein [Mesorhizobium sp. M00.F.Ca.ET.158.01.1.1]
MNTHAATDPLIRDKEAAAMLSVSVRTFWRWVSEGDAPRPLKMGGISRWPRSEISGMIERAKAAREAA